MGPIFQVETLKIPRSHASGNLTSATTLEHQLITTLCLPAQLLSCVQLFATPWTVGRQVPLSMGFSRQAYWSVWPFPPPGDLPDPGIETASPAFPESQADSLWLYLPPPPSQQEEDFNPLSPLEMGTCPRSPVMKGRWGQTLGTEWSHCVLSPQPMNPHKSHCPI